MGQSGHFYSHMDLVWSLLIVGTGFVPWVELPIQRRFCLIFVSGVGLPDIHEYSTGWRIVNEPPRIGVSQFWGVTTVTVLRMLPRINTCRGDIIMLLL